MAKTAKQRKRDKADTQTVVRRALERAEDYYREKLEPDQEDATDYYFARPFGDEQDGRSKVVSSDVRDATMAQLPSLMRIFHGPDRAVEYRAHSPQKEPEAKQATEYVNYVFLEDNDGFMVTYSAFMDALVRRLGVVKWYWEAKDEIEEVRLEGLTMEAVQVLSGEPSVEDLSLVDRGDGLLDARVTRRKSDGRARVEAVPPEEFRFTPNARSIDAAPLVAHVREVPVDELRQLGVSETLIEKAVGKTVAAASESLRTARRFDEGTDEDDEDARDESQRPILCAEAYCMVDGDNDGIAELRKFICVGPQYEISNGDGDGEIVDEVPFAVFCAYPEPHTVVGLSNWDLLKDVQRINSQLERGALDSMAQSIESKTEVVESQVNLDDLINPEVSGIIRVRQPGMMREIDHTFIGPQVLELIAYQNEKKENRLGISKAAAGLDADSLQSATKAAVAATLSAAQQHIELIARIFAEGGMTRLFRGLLKLIVKHQDRPRVVRLRESYVEVDPREWDATMDVSVNVALGQGAPEDRLMALQALGEHQMALMQAGAPFVNWTHIRYTLARAVELAGYPNPDSFFAPWGPEQQQQMAQMQAQQPQQPDPNMALVQVEQAKVQGQMQIEQFRAQIDMEKESQKLELERWKAQQEDDRERDRIARESALKELELQLKYAAQLNQAATDAHVERERAALDASVEHANNAMQAEIVSQQAQQPTSEGE